ncbi:TPA: type II toxin-antitoxin system PemK/MazF family toxin [Campylobacter jejuni]|nr:type II toxin-antitoxin system PemK/MazF family toxin [Campylobacter jejuni]
MINCNDKFDKWNNEKKKLQIKENKIISIGKIYWVLVLNKIYIEDYVNLFVGVPLTSKIENKTGFLYHHFTDSKNRKQVALLSQVRTFDTKRIISYYNGKIKKEDLETIREKITKKIISPHRAG